MYSVLTYLALPVKDARPMQMKVSRIVEQYSDRQALSESVSKSINAGEMVKDDRAADDRALSDNPQRGPGRAIVVSVNESENQILVC
jgi:hypothetical protein